jgi:restriction endonuclease S subunit
LQQFEVETGGIGKGEISEDRLLAVNVPLPSLSEQNDIVVRWFKAQDKIAAANDRIVKLEAEVPLLLYHLLGTPPPLTSKPVEKFLALWWKDLERWSFNFLSRSAQGLTGFSTSKYPIESLGTHLIETMNGYCIKPVAGPTPHKMLKLNALLPSGLDLSASKFIKIPDRIAQRFSIHKGDLFICRSVGSYSHVAKCALAKEDAPDTLFPDIMIRVRLKDTLLPEYVCEVIQSPLGRSFFQSNARTSVGMWKIGSEDIASFPIPIPPLSVQRKIMERVAAGREKIAREKANAERLSREISAEIEALILGTKRIG